MDENNKQKDRYFLAVKVFLEKDGKFLILKDAYGQWDLPGGRVKKDEFETPFHQIIKRKLNEEIGSLEYTINNTPKIFMRHIRQEKVDNDPEARIFALGYIAKLKKGVIQLSPAHSETKWVDPSTFIPGNYFTGGWLQGVQDYLRLKAS